jgi:Fe-S oxidoreductase
MIHVSRLVNTHHRQLDLKTTEMTLAYHYPCHLKIQPEPDSSVRMLNDIEGISVIAMDTNCCGIAGSWGMSAANYGLSAEIGQQLNNKLSNCDAVAGVTDCPTCRMQMEHFSSLPIRHPIEVLSELLTD